MVRRVFVEKKSGFDVEARGLKKELSERLGIAGIESVRVVGRYDVEGLSDELYEKAKAQVFFEAGLDDVYEGEMPSIGGETQKPDDDIFVFGIELLPGQFDQRADSAETCIRLLDAGAEAAGAADAKGSARAAEPRVRFAKMIIIEGPSVAQSPGSNEAHDPGEDAISAVETREAILNYCVNPVDTKQASFEVPETLYEPAPEPPDVEIVTGFRAMDEEELCAYSEAMGFAMFKEDLLFVQSYFNDEEGREPTITELRAIDTYWSDHCRHSTFFTHLTEISFEEDGGTAALVKRAYDEYLGVREELYGEAARTRPVTFMDMATIGAKYIKSKGLLDDLDESEEVNACSIRVKAEMVPAPGEEKRRDGSAKRIARSASDEAADFSGARLEPVTEDWLVMFKNETHNHPTEIEPFGGAATCLGGGIRDPLSGRAHVYQAMRITGSGNPGISIEDTLPGKLTQYQITRTAAKGYSSYGNQIGVTSGLVEEIYDNKFIAKRMELGAVVAAAPAENVVREIPAPGDAILVVGGKTGRDGIGGATGSSKEHTEESVKKAGAEVQKGNPLLERDFMRLFRRGEATRLIRRCNDFGAGGVSVAVGELAPGIDVEIDKVPVKYEGMDGTEIALSESQERMAVVVAEKDVAEFSAYAAEENVEVTRIATVTDKGRFRMYWRGACILDLSREFLDSSGIPQKRKVTVRNSSPSTVAIASEKPSVIASDSEAIQSRTCSSIESAEALLEAFEDLNVAGQRGLIEYFDSTIGAGTLLMPLGGERQLTPALGMAAKLPVLTGDTNTATLMSFGYDPAVSTASPFHGAMYAVTDCVAKICAMGGDTGKIRLSFQEYFPKPGTDPERWAMPFEALLGALKTQLALGLPSVGGKDSMSGSFGDIDVPPTLVSFAISAADARHILSPEFKQTGSRLVLLECPRDEEGVPDFASFKSNTERVYALSREGKILAANTIPQGGLFAAVAKMALGNGIGAIISASEEGMQKSEGRVFCLLGERYGSLLLEIDSAEAPEVLFEGLSYTVIGETADSGAIEVRGLAKPVEQPLVISLADIEKRWEAPLAATFPVDAGTTSGGDFGVTRKDVTTESPLWPKVYQKGRPRDRTSRAKGAETSGTEARRSSSAGPAARPRVFIPVLPGTICEVDGMRAFERAGADVSVVNLLTMTPESLEASTKRMAEEIRQSQMIMIPGGASGGDEPGGSAKFITAVFRNPYIAEAIEDLLENRDGLILGVSTGFHALLKLGLLPYGRFTAPGAGTGSFAEPGTELGASPGAEPPYRAPALTANTIGRHMSRIVRTRICSTLSPWFANAETGDIHSLPVSFGDGRFTASEKTLKTLAEAGQIATQYVDLKGEPTYDVRYNPGCSALAIEGITSPDGRIFGRMGHPERNASGLYVNVPGDFDAGVFKAGVAYFK